jgi:hypothetical protein
MAHYRKRKTISVALVVLVAILAIFSYLTNPFVRFSLIIDPYKNYQYQDGQLSLKRDSSLIVRDDAFFRQLALLKSGWHILDTRFVSPKGTQGSIDETIRQIHQQRFNPDQPFLISGEHFSVLYPRSLGIFYNTLLDPRTALDQTDWQNRQLIYLKTTAYALQVFEQSDRLSTTIVPVGPRSVALVNIYAPPSDTLYSLLYALTVLSNDKYLSQLYPFGVSPRVKLETQQQAQQLLADHKTSLQNHFKKYWGEVYDSQTGLVKTNIRLSGTKDSAIRESSFYDNVIAWKTFQLAQELGLTDKNEQTLKDYKQKILQTFWLEPEGYFLEDLSPKAKLAKYYSSDWLIVLMTGFLNPTNKSEQSYYTRSIAYIQRNAIDQPFGLQYHPDPRPEQLYLPVRLMAPTYASTAIWSSWGMEYIKALLSLAQVTKDTDYLHSAEQQLNSYTFNIKRYGGFPEVYDKNGDLFSQRLYKSVRETGWIVNYEEARAMLDWTRNQLLKK